MNDEYEFHYTVVYNVATGKFRVEDGLGFPADEPVWNGAFWERVNEDTYGIDRGAILELRSMLGEMEVAK